MYMQSKEIDVIKQDRMRRGCGVRRFTGSIACKVTNGPLHGFHCEDKGDSGGAKAGSNQGLRSFLISFRFCNDGTD